MTILGDGSRRRQDKEEQKRLIRERYNKTSMDDTDLEVIPAKPQIDIYKDERPRRVAVYARVSTDSVNQTTSYELQKSYYEDLVLKHPNWTLVNIYADEGISGTSLKHRAAFNQMISDCKAGMIDLIVTKSVSRFARNIVDCISLVRQLASYTPPIGVFFESEQLFSLKTDSEMSLSFIATMAQEESHIKSTIMNASIEMRFGRQIYLTPVLLGYDHDEDGNLVINPEEAKTVRLIFFLYLFGYTCGQIAELLMSLKRPTKRGSLAWSAGTVLGVLRNERHCGAVYAHKTFTPSYLDHKSKVNRGERTMYKKMNHHEAIISPEDYLAVQRLISNARYGNSGILPELHVMQEGVLKGFVIVHPRWAGFTPENYITACESVCNQAGEAKPPLDAEITVETQPGEFDLRGFEIARSQFFDVDGALGSTFNIKSLKFSTACIKQIEGLLHVELLVHPIEHLLAVRPVKKQSRCSVQWAKITGDGVYVPRVISGAAFLPTLFQLFGWNERYSYRLRGILRKREDEAVLLFNLQETEVFLPTGIVLEAADHADAAHQVLRPSKRTQLAFPPNMVAGFGNNYYVQAQARELAEIDQQWQLHGCAKPAGDGTDTVFRSPEMEEAIRQLITEMKEVTTHGD